jgi:hypothetical protein
MFGLNAGYSSTNNPREELEARKSWHHYQNLYFNFFQFFGRNEFQSPYYTALGYLLSGLLKKQFFNEGKWRLFDKYLANIELIPYHSEGISLPSNFSSFQLAYLTERYKVGLEFIMRSSPKLLIFYGNTWEKVDDLELMNDEEIKSLNISINALHRDLQRDDSSKRVLLCSVCKHANLDESLYCNMCGQFLRVNI